MLSIEISSTFPLSSVKPFEKLAAYRKACMDLTRAALAKGTSRRSLCPLEGLALVPLGPMEGFSYGRCPRDGSLFLMDLPDREAWAHLLSQGVRLRHSPEGFHRHLAQSRMDHVYAPKLEWIEETLRLQSIVSPRILEATTLPSDFTQLLKESGSFSEVLTEDETVLAGGASGGDPDPVDAVALLESFDHSVDPVGLLHTIRKRLRPGGLLFSTALVASGFDIRVLGLRNRYLIPPDRANCFSLAGMMRLMEKNGFTLLEVSTAGVLDVEIVRAHCQLDPTLPLSDFERQIVEADEATRQAFQSFLQQQGMSSFARWVARRTS